MECVDFEKLIKINQIRCPCCEEGAEVVIDLPEYPVTEFYKSIDDDRAPFGFIDQAVRYCTSCNHMFLEKVLSAEKIYSDENYITSTISSKGAVECVDELVSFINKTSTNDDFSGATVIDIGGNDSSLLKAYIDYECNLINIDPNASTDNDKIEVRREFFENIDFSSFSNIQKKIFVSSHTIEHLENPAKLLRELVEYVTEVDIIYLQFPSMEKVVEQQRYDQICHQHINYFSLKSISKLMAKEGVYVQQHEFDTSHFGTLRIKLARKQPEKHIHVVPPKLYKVDQSYQSFREYYDSLNHSIYDLFKNGQGFGAGLMVPTIAYNLPVIDDLSIIIDENPLRTGKRFINLSPPIDSIDKLDVNAPVLITSISTKAAARGIFSKLVGLGIKDICIPSTII